SLRLLGTVGEPINPEAWIWYRDHIGAGKTPVVDTWWQTETGMIMITPLPGITTTKPGSATKPFPGVEPAVFDNNGKEVGPGGAGGVGPRRSTDRPGHRGLRHPQGRQGRLIRHDARAPRPRRQEDRADRPAGEYRLHAGVAQDALRQDHASPAERRGRKPS